ncbi:hypothetical protein KDW_63440 [Dictyobacter vulcani]|uniref:Uncharacterized protein n=1 Tax=Dictyobacter vulcani TaxID=2607529 RepID=A0A5J4KYM5_9CHLR|nr:glucosaminidase domain-containing protein [Dictyobacter vulcani]GER92182.1 hypothetical protein KDW_63440 [Dictyobacter vulcani]
MGKGQLFYSLGKDHNIDSTFILAIAMHDSELGKTTHANQTHSLAPLGCYQGVHCVNHYAAYNNWEAGIRDLYIIFEYYIYTLHKTTVDTIVPTFAGPLANTSAKQQAYVVFVKQVMDRWRSGQVLAD